ncbi:MAG: phenylalanine--tRNA ligase subunit beta, partial [Alphaproteobacteria bacterium]
MKFTLSWLKDHLDTNASLEQITEKLTAIGLEVESVTNRSEELKPFTVAKVLHAQQHPDADKLRVCKVQSNNGELQIVCGAPNARAGIYVALAQEGAWIPKHAFSIKKSNIRGVESNGMLCSSDELNLGEDSNGIMELPEAKIGTPIADVLGLNDPIIEIAITPNRPDALGVHGIARDLAAAGMGTLKPLADTSGVKGSFDSAISVEIATGHCNQFVGHHIKGVKNGPSPAWLQQRLKAIGLRPISALVDITNYLTFDLGRPLHVYDAGKLQGNLTVRAAAAGETIHALDDNQYTLPPSITVIADASGPVAVGGVIGGLESGCSDDTNEVFLEAALFDPVSVASSGRTLALQTDARYRFERGVDANFAEAGARHAVQMILDLCGGTASKPVMAGSVPAWQRSIRFSPELVKTLGGADVATSDIKRILLALGFACSEKGHELEISPPSWRPDIGGEADMVEEILRIVGYDHIPAATLPPSNRFMKPALNNAQRRSSLARRVLSARGFMECHTWSFIPDRQAKLFGGGKTELKLANPISADLDSMRPSLIPNLLGAAERNMRRGLQNLSLAEVGLTFHGTKPEEQTLCAAAIRIGAIDSYQYGENFHIRSKPVDVFDAKADALAVLSALGVQKFDIITETPSWYHPGRSGAVTLGGKIILGYFGELHPAILKQMDLHDIQAVACELFPDSLPQARKKSKSKPPLQISDYQAVERDFAFLVDEALPATEVIKTIEKADKKL